MDQFFFFWKNFQGHANLPAEVEGKKGKVNKTTSVKKRRLWLSQMFVVCSSSSIRFPKTPHNLPHRAI
jgi:hypothetical protein